MYALHSFKALKKFKINIIIPVWLVHEMAKREKKGNLKSKFIFITQLF